MTGTPIAPQRRHTLLFLRRIREFAPVFLDTEVDMSRVSRHRAEAAERGKRYSFVSYVLLAGARALVEHPQANAAIKGRLRPRVARFPMVSGKLALDKRLGGERIVLSTVLPNLGDASLDDIQDQVDHFRDGDPARMPEFVAVRKLHGLPWWLAPALFRRVMAPLATRPATMGTFAVSSLGHRSVDGFHSVGGTTITLGVGRVLDRPVVRDGRVVVAPVMRLNLCFDHRVIDGAEAADLLTDIRCGLEEFTK